MLELAPAALPIDRARRVRPVRRRRPDFKETALRISFFDALELDADRLARQHALDEDRQRSIMRQPLAAMDQLVDLDENGFVCLCFGGRHGGWSVARTFLARVTPVGGPRKSEPESSGLRRAAGKRGKPAAGPALIKLERPLAELIELAVLDPVQQRRDQQLRIPQAQPLGLAQHEVHLIADLEHRGKVHEVRLRPLPIPPRFVDKTGDELLALAREIDHAAVGMRQERDRGDLKKSACTLWPKPVTRHWMAQKSVRGG